MGNNYTWMEENRTLLTKGTKSNQEKEEEITKAGSK